MPCGCPTLRDAGLPVEVVPGWERRGNDPSEWLALVDHHTASNPKGGPRPSLGVCTHGRPGVPGPLCNDLLDRDGVFVIVAAGAANHPGVAWIPQRGGIGSGVKYWTLGCEVELSGVGEPFPVEGRQYEHMIRADAAISIYLGLDPSTDLFDHKAVARPHGRKIDVHPYDLNDGRVRVARKMTGHRPPTTTPTPGDLTVTEAQRLDKRIDVMRDATKFLLEVLQQQLELQQRQIDGAHRRIDLLRDATLLIRSGDLARVAQLEAELAAVDADLAATDAEVKRLALVVADSLAAAA